MESDMTVDPSLESDESAEEWPSESPTETLSPSESAYN